MNPPILYVAHPYSNDPIKSFRNAQRWTYLLRRKGLPVFSPILHTHPYYVTISEDFGMFGYPNGEVEEFTNYMNTENFVDWDLKIIEGFMKSDGTSGMGICTRCGWKMAKFVKNFWCANCDADMREIKPGFDSGIIILLSNTAFIKLDTKCIKDGITYRYKKGIGLDFHWLSKGCRQEYEFAKSKHIRVLCLEDFLEGKEVDL